MSLEDKIAEDNKPWYESGRGWLLYRFLELVDIRRNDPALEIGIYYCPVTRSSPNQKWLRNHFKSGLI